MSKFLVFPEEEVYLNSNKPVIITEKSKELAKECYFENLKEINPDTYEDIIDSITRQGDTYADYFMADVCMNCEHHVKCREECIKGDDWWYSQYVLYFNGNEDLAKYTFFTNFDKEPIDENSDILKKVIKTILNKGYLGDLVIIDLNLIKKFKG